MSWWYLDAFCALLLCVLVFLCISDRSGSSVAFWRHGRSRNQVALRLLWLRDREGWTKVWYIRY